MKKILAPIVLLSVLVFGGTARADLPLCSQICSCTIHCNVYMPCHANGFDTTCAGFGKCKEGSKCNPVAPTEPAAQLKLATPATKPAICTAGDNPFATDDDNCLLQR